jgi:hypothetical protein
MVARHDSLNCDAMLDLGACNAKLGVGSWMILEAQAQHLREPYARLKLPRLWTPV